MQAAAEDQFVDMLTSLLHSWQFKEGICEQISNKVEEVEAFYGKRCACHSDRDGPLFLGWLLPPDISDLTEQSKKIRQKLMQNGLDRLMSLEDEEIYVSRMQSDELKKAKAAAKSSDMDTAVAELKKVIEKITSPQIGRWTQNSEAMGRLLIDLFSDELYEARKQAGTAKLLIKDLKEFGFSNHSSPIDPSVFELLPPRAIQEISTAAPAYGMLLPGGARGIRKFLTGDSDLFFIGNGPLSSGLFPARQLIRLASQRIDVRRIINPSAAEPAADINSPDDPDSDDPDSEVDEADTATERAIASYQLLVKPRIYMSQCMDECDQMLPAMLQDIERIASEMGC